MARTRYTSKGGYIYVGIRIDTGKRELFRWAGTPVRETHGHIYAAAIGPFRTVRGARFMVERGANNPHVQHVRDAERIAKELDY